MSGTANIVVDWWPLWRDDCTGGLGHIGARRRSSRRRCVFVGARRRRAPVLAAAVLYRTMLSGIDSAAATRVSEWPRRSRRTAPRGVDAANCWPPMSGSWRSRSSPRTARWCGGRRSAPDTPLVPIGRGRRRPAHRDARAHFAVRPDPLQRPDRGRRPTARYTILVGEGSATVASTVWTVVIALAIAAPIVIAVSGRRHLPAGASFDAVGRRHPLPGRRHHHVGSHRTGAGARQSRRDRGARGHDERDAGPHRGRAHRAAAVRRRRLARAAQPADDDHLGARGGGRPPGGARRRARHDAR